MKALLLTALAILGGGPWLSELHAHGGTYVAHGGTYVGPSGTTPPTGGGPSGGGGGGGGGPSGGGPSGPSNGGGSPSTGGSATPGGGSSGNGGNSGSSSSGPSSSNGGPAVDLETWTLWWEFNKNQYLHLQAAVAHGGSKKGSADFFLGADQTGQAKDSLRPGETMIRDEIVPALLEALANETNPDILTGALIALAKIGEAPGETRLEERIASFLAVPNQEISETAALSLGILASDASIEVLEALVRDTVAGQEMVDSTEVDPRTRAFAGYGLGLLGAQTSDESLRRRINALIVEQLPAADRSARQDLAAALIISMGLTPLEIAAPQISPSPIAWDPTTSRQGQIEFLLDYLGDQDRNFISRSHAPTAMARLLHGMDDATGYRDRVALALMDLIDPRSKSRAEQDEIKWSAALALGLVGDADSDAIDRRIRRTLIVDADKQQRQGRMFAKIALAKIAADEGSGDGVDEGRKEIVGDLSASLLHGTGGDQHWGALALGVHGFLLREQGRELGTALAESLRKELEQARTAQDVAALAIANGLLEDQSALEPLLEKLERVSDPREKGYVALALGLTNDRRAIPPIAEVLAEAVYKPDLLRQAAIALGLLGDKDAVETLIGMLVRARSLAAQASLATALGFIGDRRSVGPLIELLRDDARTEISRAFAAVALGIVADKEPLPWNTKIAVDLNYRAAIPTLNTPDNKGVLNIL